MSGWVGIVWGGGIGQCWSWEIYSQEAKFGILFWPSGGGCLGLLASFHAPVPIEKVDGLHTWLDNLGFLWGREGLAGTRSCHCGCIFGRGGGRFPRRTQALWPLPEQSLPHMPHVSIVLQHHLESRPPSPGQDWFWAETLNVCYHPSSAFEQPPKIRNWRKPSRQSQALPSVSSGVFV